MSLTPTRRPLLVVLSLLLALIVPGFVQPPSAATTSPPPPMPLHDGDVMPAPASTPTARDAASPELAYTLAVYYVLPADVPFDQAVLDRLKDASLDIRSWYQVASGGLTWEWASPEIVEVHQGQHTRAYYLENGNWWGSLLSEMGSAGLPVWRPGVVTAIWAQGAGWWAGGAQGCESDCGVVLLGVELFPQFNNPAWTGGACPDPTGRGVDAWPCTPEGAYAHELGHTLGLPHPLDDPVTAPYAFHSLMQTHWNYPDEARGDEVPWGFLASERQRIRSNPFMKAGIPLWQRYQDLDIVVNLPPGGALPVASFAMTTVGNAVTFDNLSQGADLYYWTFGDHAASNAASPTHAYGNIGAYTARLWASNDLGMLSTTDRQVEIQSIPWKMFLPIILHD